MPASSSENMEIFEKSDNKPDNYSENVEIMQKINNKPNNYSEYAEIMQKINNKPDNYSENAEITEKCNNRADIYEETRNDEENIKNEVALNNPKFIKDERVNNEEEIIHKKEVPNEENQSEETTNAGSRNEAAVNTEESVGNKENVEEVIDEDTPNDSDPVNIPTKEQRYFIEEDSEVRAEPLETSVDSNTEVAAESSVDTIKDAVGTEQNTSAGDYTVLEAETTVVEVIEPQEAVASSQEYVQEVAILQSSSEAESAVAEILPREEYEHPESVEYQVILSDASDVTVNGVHDTDKQVFQGQIIEIGKTGVRYIVAIAGGIQTTEACIAIPSETEVTFTDAVEQQMMALPDLTEEQMIIMEAECESTEEELEEGKEQEDKEKLANIPCHVLGRSVDKPLVDPVKNRRVLLKPRLGVKIPYRNLTSQIVSKQEIVEELMERSRLRQSNADPPGGDVFFAQKLAQRLARKLEPSAPSTSKKDGKAKPASPKKPPQPPPSALPPNEKVIDNSDLISLLEGDDVPDWNIGRREETPIKEEDVKPPPEWERELALKQLKKLPKNSRWKTRRREVIREVSKVVEASKVVEVSKPAEKAPKVVEKGLKSAEKFPKLVEERKEVEKKEKESALDDDEKDLIEPRFSSMQAVKTYTRKRKPLVEDLITFISPKKPAEKLAEDDPPVLSPQIPINQPSAAQTFSPKNPTNVQKSASTSQKSPQKSISNPKPAKLKENKNSGRPKVVSPNTYTSKSSRIVKRKKIWNPNEVTPSKLKSLKFEDKSTTPSPEKRPKLYFF